MSTRLPLPVRRVLREPMSDDAIERILARGHTRSTPRRGRSGVALLAVAAVVALGWTVWPTAGPLRLAGGGAIGVHPASHDRSGTIAFEDGSELTLAGEPSLVTLQNDAREIALLLERGVVTFDVEPNGPRRWTIECGLATVVVVGTRFTIERDERHLVVSVERGAVIVRGERVPDRVRRLEAGERLELRETRDAASSEQVERPIDPLAGARAEPRDAPVEPPPAERGPRASWRALAAATEWDAAFRALGPGGVTRAAERATVDDLLTLADVARLSGHLAEAVAPLEQIVEQHASDPEASLAAFSLGRIEDQLGHPARAARAFERALTLGGLPDALRGDALARRVASLQRAGDHAGAAAGAATYLREHASGPHADAMRAILELP